MPHRYHPDVPSPIHNPSSGHHHLHHSPSAILSARALLRRVRSGSSIRGEEGTFFTSSSTISPAGVGVVVSPETEVNREVQQEKKEGPIDKFVRKLDSSLAFAEGR